MKDTLECIANKSDIRPIVLLDNNIRALIDSGADRNMWVGSLFKMNKYVHRYLGRLKGHTEAFTGDKVGGDVYHMWFKVGKFIWDNTTFIIPDRRSSESSFDIILGTNLFKDFIVCNSYINNSIVLIKNDDNINCRDIVFENGTKKYGSVNAYLNSISINTDEDELGDLHL